GNGGPLQNASNPTVPISNDIADSAKLPVFWGVQQLQGLHVGFFVALAALVVFYLVLNRTTLGFEVRAVGFNPEAAACGGISVWAQRLDGPVLARLRDPRTSGIAGIALAVLACLLALPPLAERSILWPILVGLAAMMLGLWTATRGLRRLGWGAVVSGLL